MVMLERSWEPRGSSVENKAEPTSGLTVLAGEGGWVGGAGRGREEMWEGEIGGDGGS